MYSVKFSYHTCTQGQNNGYAKSNAAKEQIKHNHGNNCNNHNNHNKKKKKMSKKQYKKMMKSAAEFGTESTVMKPGREGEPKQMIQAYVVPRHEILENPAFEGVRELEGLGGSCRQRKSSNIRSSSVESVQNNSSKNKNKCKRGIVKNFTNNNLGGAETEVQQHKSLKEKFQEFIAKRETYSLYIFPPDSSLRIMCADLTSQARRLD